MPIIPPKASTSRTTIPFADPPIDGLQGIFEIIFLLRVIKRVFKPICAQAAQASTPACPPPTTMISYSFIIRRYLPYPS